MYRDQPVLELSFATPEIRAVCEDNELAHSRYGEAVSTALRGRLADLRATRCVLDIPIGSPRPVVGRADFLQIDLADGVVLHVCSGSKSSVRTESGNIDWSKVSRLKIVEIRSD